MRALAVTMLLLPSIALAQAAPPAPLPRPPAAIDPGECTVTTTVRCTGAAAPYAIEAAKPEAPVVIQAPAPPPAPTAPQMLAPPPGAIVLDPRALGDGWRIVQSGDGSLWRERKISTDAPGVWGTGLAFWLGGYAAGVIGGMEEGSANLFAWWPIIGALVNTSFNSGTAQAMWAIDGVAQAGGFVVFLVGLAAGPDKLERVPLTVGPATFVGGGSGVALAGHF